MDLTEARAGIDRVDREMRRLFTERMAIAGEIARIKAETDDAIYKPDREQEIIKRQTGNIEPGLQMEYKAFIRRVMEISRKYQYGLTVELKDMEEEGLSVPPEHDRILLMFTCAGKCNDLGKILTMISDYGIVVTEISAMPFPENGSHNYRFFVELAADADRKTIRTLLYQLSRETETLKILESYKSSGCRADHE